MARLLKKLAEKHNYRVTFFLVNFESVSYAVTARTRNSADRFAVREYIESGYPTESIRRMAVARTDR